MKNIILLTQLLFAAQLLTAQIGDVRQDGRELHIYDEDLKYTKTIRMCKYCELVGFNSRYVVTSERNFKAYITDPFGKRKGGFIDFCRGCYIKNVTGTSIIMSDGYKTWAKKFSDFENGLYQQRTFE